LSSRLGLHQRPADGKRIANEVDTVHYSRLPSRAGADDSGEGADIYEFLDRHGRARLAGPGGGIRGLARPKQSRCHAGGMAAWARAGPDRRGRTRRFGCRRTHAHRLRLGGGRSLPGARGVLSRAGADAGASGDGLLHIGARNVGNVAVAAGYTRDDVVGVWTGPYASGGAGGLHRCSDASGALGIVAISAMVHNDASRQTTQVAKIERHSAMPPRACGPLLRNIRWSRLPAGPQARCINGASKSSSL